MLDVAIAFVIFNRPESTKASFERIRATQPKKLFLVSDAPRVDHPRDADLVEQTRRIAEQVDWECEVTKLYAEKNLGCGKRISSGITEALEQVDALIVLEDDCVADPTFFPFCVDLLNRYADDERVMTISGSNFQQGVRHTPASYYFSKFMHCWGWATWKRAWQKFDLGISEWPSFRDAGYLAASCASVHEQRYWTKILDSVYAGQIDSWAYPCQLSCWMHNGLTIIPEVNLISNIGFDENATHTHRKSRISNQPSESLQSIDHPNLVVRHAAADLFTDDLMYSRPSRNLRPLRRLTNALKSRRRAA